MARHRGTYKPENPEPYELSRSRLATFLNHLLGSYGLYDR